MYAGCGEAVICVAAEKYQVLQRTWAESCVCENVSRVSPPRRAARSDDKPSDDTGRLAQYTQY